MLRQGFATDTVQHKLTAENTVQQTSKCVLTSYPGSFRVCKLILDLVGNEFFILLHVLQCQ